MNKISVCLWFDHQAEAAARFYAGLFENSHVGTILKYGPSGAEASGQKVGTTMTVDFQLENAEILGLNGGPIFKHTPASSFFVRCRSEDEIDAKWKALSSGGQVRMGLDKYPWAEKYGWTADKYGVEWQLILQPVGARISPALLFVDRLFGKGREALEFYMSVFPDSKIETLAEDPRNKTILHAAFKLYGTDIVLMEGQGEHGHTFNESFSLMVHCKDQAEIDRVWNKLIEEGGSPSQCGWLKDKFGVSWQIVPENLRTIMKDPVRAERAMAVVMKMGKLDKAAIEAAAK